MDHVHGSVCVREDSLGGGLLLEATQLFGEPLGTPVQLPRQDVTHPACRLGHAGRRRRARLAEELASGEQPKAGAS